MSDLTRKSPSDLSSSPARAAARQRTNFKKKYGITPEQYAKMLASQKGVCKICGGVSSDRSLAVDHNHETGEVRGLLCGPCNMGLGLFKDNPMLLRDAATYLDQQS